MYDTPPRPPHTSNVKSSKKMNLNVTEILRFVKTTAFIFLNF